MKIGLDNDCGSIAENLEKSPSQEVLEEKGEIFSCGGVYLSTFRPVTRKSEAPRYLHLPNLRREVLVVQGSKVQRFGGSRFHSPEESLQEMQNSQDVLRRLSKESLN